MTEEHIRISRDFESERDIIHLPEVAYSYFDTQAGAVDIGLDREWMKTLLRTLMEWITVTSYVDNPIAVEDIDNPCMHEDVWLDRTVCPDPCGSVHTYCCACATRMDGCLTEDLAISLQELRDGKSIPAKTRNEEFLYDGQDLNEMCHCGHAAMVHTSGSGNCLALGESAQEDSHCLEFFSPPDTCTDCGHATIHGVGTPGVFPQFCEIKKCNCTGSETPCDECPHSFWQHQQGDGGCPHCDCRVGERVIPPDLSEDK